MTLRLILLTLFVAQHIFVFGQSKTSVRDSSKVTTKTADSTTIAKAATDTTAEKKKEPKPPYVHQIRLGFDISRIAFNLMYPSKQAYEVQADYALRGKLYLAAEAGFGNGKIDYDNLKYNNNGFFIRAGVDNSILDKLTDSDFDMAFIGVRYGMGVGKRSEATYFVTSPFGAPVSGNVPAQNFVVHWGEIAAGIKVEFVKNFFAGYTMRGKFMLNSGVFEELAPNYVPGYGKGDKTVVFDFNFYLSYAIQWGGKPTPVAK